MFNFQISLDQLQDENPHVRLAACDDIARLESQIPENLIDPIVEHMVNESNDVDQDYRIRKEAMNALAALGPRAKSASAALIELLRDSDYEIRTEAFLALTQTGFDSLQYVQAIHRAVLEKDPPTLNMLSLLLNKFSRSKEVLLEDYIYGLQFEETRQICIDTIYNVTSPERYPEVKQALLMAVLDANGNEKASALHVIKQMGGAQSDLFNSLQDEMDQFLKTMDQEQDPTLSLEEKANLFHERQNFLADAETEGLESALSLYEERDWDLYRIMAGVTEVAKNGSSYALRRQALMHLTSNLESAEPELRGIGLQALRELEFKAYPVLAQITSLLHDTNELVALEARKTFAVVFSSFAPEHGPVS